MFFRRVCVTAVPLSPTSPAEAGQEPLAMDQIWGQQTQVNALPGRQSVNGRSQVWFQVYRLSQSRWQDRCGQFGTHVTSVFDYIYHGHWRRKWQPTLVFLLGEYNGLQSMGSQRVGHDWSNWTRIMDTQREETCSSLLNWTELSSNAWGPVSLCKLPVTQHRSPPSMVFDNRKSGNPRVGHEINLEP